MKRLFLWIFCAVLPLTAAAQEETLTLDQCVDAALKRNNDIVQSNINLKITSRDEITALSHFLPTLDAGLGYSHQVFGPSSLLRFDSQSGSLVPANLKQISWNSRVNFTAQQMIFDGGNIFGFFQAKYMKNSAKFSNENTRQDIIFQVKQAYYDLLKKEKLLQAQEETLKQWDESYKRTDMMYQVGKVAKSDVLRAKVQLENSRLALIQAQNNLLLANAQLNYVLGYPVDRKIKTVDVTEQPTEDISYEDALNKAISIHPMLRKSQADMKASKAGVATASSSFLPAVYASGSYSWTNQKLDQIKHILDSDYNWSLGVSLSIPIFQGFSRIASVSKAQLQYKASRETYEQTKRDLSLQVKQTLAAVEVAKQQIAAAADAEAAAGEDLRLNKEKYELGSGTMLDLITSQAAYTTAQNDHIQALYDYHTAYAQLQKAMGVLK